MPAHSLTWAAGVYIFDFAPPGGGGKNMSYWLVGGKNHYS